MPTQRRLGSIALACACAGACAPATRSAPVPKQSAPIAPPGTARADCATAARRLDDVAERLTPGQHLSPYAKLCAADKARSVAAMCPALRERALALAKSAEYDE